VTDERRRGYTEVCSAVSSGQAGGPTSVEWPSWVHGPGQSQGWTLTSISDPDDTEGSLLTRRALGFGCGLATSGTH
jgi:hypothetical protein